MNATTQDSRTSAQHPNAPFGKLSLVKSPFNHGGGYIGCYSEVGDIFAGFAEIDPTGGIRALTDVDKTATALIACWNACSGAGLTVEQLKAGTIKQAMEENARLKKALSDLAVYAEALLSEQDVPDPNCSCHLAPPCDDCVEYSGIREIIGDCAASVSAARALLSPATP